MLWLNIHKVVLDYASATAQPFSQLPIQRGMFMFFYIITVAVGSADFYQYKHHSWTKKPQKEGV